jgi:hypothetical protein
MNLRMLRVNGIAATRRVRARAKPPEVIVLRALRAGASGFLLKDAPPAEITEAILRPTSDTHRQSTTTTTPTNSCTATAATPTNRPDAECSFRSGRRPPARTSHLVSTFVLCLPSSAVEGC